MSLKVRYADGSIREVTDPSEALEIYRHSTSHLMAAAVSSLFPGTHLGIGPAISDGFFYEFQRDESFVEDDLPRIEERMRELVQKDLQYEPSIITKQEAIDYFSRQGEHLKVELIQEKAGETLSCYRLGDLIDFCTGPHVYSTGRIDPESFQVSSIAGSYWKGDERNQRLQRIHGTAFLTPEDLKSYLSQLEEAKKRDHRKLGRELDLFSISEEAGPGLIFGYTKGTRVRVVVEDFLRQEITRRGYEMVATPHVARNTLWKTSGHYDYYRDNMYVFNIDDEEFVIKPMNCPGHIQIYKSRLRSYRDLPLRFAVFYGPKIDVKLIDAIGRPWQLSTVQFDFTLPKRFDLRYIGPDGQSHQPVMLHRALLGSVERFMGVLIEHYAGAFPIWLAPVQVRVIPIAERHQEYGRQVVSRLRETGVRVELDDRNEKMGFKIREAQTQKVPYMLVVGDKEAQSGQVAVRNRFEGDEGPQPLERFIEKIREFIEARSVRP